MYQDGKLGEVETYQLDALISSSKIRKFQRSGEWVTIGADPIREFRRVYLETPKEPNFSKKARKRK